MFDLSFDEDALYSATQLSDAVSSSRVVSTNSDHGSLSVASSKNQAVYDVDVDSEIENVDPAGSIINLF